MQNDFERFLQNTSENVNEILMSSDEETKSTSVIKQAKWPVGQTFCAFSMPDCLVTHEEIENQIFDTYVKSKSIWTMLPGGNSCIRKKKYKDDLQTHIVKVR